MHKTNQLIFNLFFNVKHINVASNTKQTDD